jgi:hypothetical protein
MMGDYTDLLYARPSFPEGVARIMDLAGALNVYNQAAPPEQADAWALWSDWAAIGQDFRAAAARLAAEQAAAGGSPA